MFAGKVPVWPKEMFYGASETPKPNPLVPDPVEKQGISINTSVSMKYHYNQHNQNTIIPLPGDLLFNFRSPPHEHESNDTLIVLTLPALNTLLRELGPRVTPTQIWDTFKLLGSVDFDWTVDPQRPLLRGIQVSVARRMRVTNLFDDVSRLEPTLTKQLPRYAYLWLRPFCVDPVTQDIVPFRAELIDVVTGQAEAHRGRDDDDGGGNANVDDVFPDDPFNADLFAAPEDEAKMMNDHFAAFGVPRDDGDAAAAVAAAAPAAAGAQPAVPPPRPPLPPLVRGHDKAAVAGHRFFWQYQPVCSTHPDLECGGKSAAMREEFDEMHIFQHYSQVISLGLMYSFPLAAPHRKPMPLDSDAARFATFGPWGPLPYYARVMLEHRCRMQLVDVDAMTL